MQVAKALLKGFMSRGLIAVLHLFCAHHLVPLPMQKIYEEHIRQIASESTNLGNFLVILADIA